LSLIVGNVAASPVQVGSKEFTESVILGEVLSGLARNQNYPVIHKEELGGRILWSALLAGEIDLYPEYTGTLRREIFADKALPGADALRQELLLHGIMMTRPLGFNNSYAIAVRQDIAERLALTRISDLQHAPGLRFGFSNAFMDRADGWPSLRQRYQLPQQALHGMEHALSYKALQQGSIDVIDAYTTDPHIALYHLRVLEDDLKHFPRYDGIVLYRRSLVDQAPLLVKALSQLEGRISDQRMLALNQQVEIEGRSETDVATHFLSETLGIGIPAQASLGLAARVWQASGEHLFLVMTSLGAAILIATPLGIIAAKRPVAGHFIVGIAEVVQTIPGLALLVFLAVIFAPLNLPTIGAWPMIAALFLYSLLPIIRNTMAGLNSVPENLRESAEVLGLPPLVRLRLIELPLASPLILAGIKTTAVINVGYAALGGLIGAGGYGQPIMTGLRLNSSALMLEGAIPAALMALAVKGMFAGLERWLVPRGLDLPRRE
jgi:osmoprotectant transport system permease protein